MGRRYYNRYNNYSHYSSNESTFNGWALFFCIFALPIFLVVYQIKFLVKICSKKHNDHLIKNYVKFSIISLCLVGLAFFPYITTATNKNSMLGILFITVPIFIAGTIVFIVKQVKSKRLSINASTTNSDNDMPRQSRTNNYHTTSNTNDNDNSAELPKLNFRHNSSVLKNNPPMGFGAECTNDIHNEEDVNEIKYVQKNGLMTDCEKTFFAVFKEVLGDKYIVQPQINLATVIQKENAIYQNELFRNIDFGVFDLNYKLLFLIEINDKSHEEYDRIIRDIKVKEICDASGIPLITLWTYYAPNAEYIKSRFAEYIDL